LDGDFFWWVEASGTRNYLPHKLDDLSKGISQAEMILNKQEPPT